MALNQKKEEKKINEIVSGHRKRTFLIFSLSFSLLLSRFLELPFSNDPPYYPRRYHRHPLGIHPFLYRARMYLETLINSRRTGEIRF